MAGFTPIEINGRYYTFFRNIESAIDNHVNQLIAGHPNVPTPGDQLLMPYPLERSSVLQTWKAHLKGYSGYKTLSLG